MYSSCLWITPLNALSSIHLHKITFRNFLDSQWKNLNNTIYRFLPNLEYQPLHIFFPLISLPSSKTMLISSFNPFSLKNQSEHSHIIEAVEYAESQFQAIMTDLYKEINKPDDNWKIWVQTLLYRELVSCFAFQIFKFLMLIHIRISYCQLLALHPHWAYLWSY